MFTILVKDKRTGNKITPTPKAEQLGMLVANDVCAHTLLRYGSLSQGLIDTDNSNS